MSYDDVTAKASLAVTEMRLTLSPALHTAAGNKTCEPGVLVRGRANLKGYTLRADSTQDVAVKAAQLGRAVIGEIRRLRGGDAATAVDLAIGVWESIATRDNIMEIATSVTPRSQPVDVISRLHRDALIHLNDYLQISRGDARLIGSARTLLTSAVGAVLRHA
jgi:hypothetical protein